MLNIFLSKVKQLINNTLSKDDKLDENFEQHPFQTDLDKNIKKIKGIFDNCSDVIYRDFSISTKIPIKAVLIYIENLSNEDIINNNILKPLMNIGDRLDKEKNDRKILSKIKRSIITVNGVQETEEVIEAINLLLAGNSLLIIDGIAKGLTLATKGYKERNVAEPQTEPSVRGPRDGFNETLRTNIGLLRRRIISTRLKTEKLQIGVLTKTDIVIAYIKGIANERVVEEIKIRLRRIETDNILASGQIAEFICDNKYSPFPQLMSTERPDRVALSLLDGQIAIMVDTTPFTLIAPVNFYQFLQAAEDYYNNYIFTTAVRLLRFLSLNIALLLPSLYVAVVTFHQEMLPTPLLVSIASAREGVPFPAFIEALLMEFTFEILREAGIRLPRAVGQAVSIVGALVIGQAAVSAGLVSPAMVIIVSLTAIANFTIPSYDGTLPIRLLRFPIMALGAALGLYGIMIGLLAILIHLCTLRSFGIPYLSPLTPTIWGDLKDTIVRAPWWGMNTRSRLIGQRDIVRQDPNQGPQKPSRKNRLIRREWKP